MSGTDSHIEYFQHFLPPMTRETPLRVLCWPFVPLTRGRHYFYNFLTSEDSACGFYRYDIQALTNKMSRHEGEKT